MPISVALTFLVVRFSSVTPSLDSKLAICFETEDFESLNLLAASVKPPLSITATKISISAIRSIYKSPSDVNMIANGLVDGFSASKITKTDVNGIERIAPGSPHIVVQNTNANKTTKLERFTDFPIILGSSILPTYV